jgi:hypothetical protein
MKNHPHKSVGCAVAMLFALGGCETLTPMLDSTFGDAVNIAKARQARDKDAPLKNARKDVAGLDGIAAKEAIDRYQKSFRAPEPTPNVFSMGLSGTQSGGSQ